VESETGSTRPALGVGLEVECAAVTAPHFDDFVHGLYSNLLHGAGFLVRGGWPRCPARDQEPCSDENDDHDNEQDSEADRSGKRTILGHAENHRDHDQPEDGEEDDTEQGKRTFLSRGGTPRGVPDLERWRGQGSRTRGVGPTRRMVLIGEMTRTRTREGWTADRGLQALL